ncbi:hypothetical protein Tco_1111415 [Tanacetum coccineum]|uniref:Uncharacterized protein n=1 Tax=Tanacetum coccineum TaxID=301880 RepID=A0ABQ5ILM2_9ASTR
MDKGVADTVKDHKRQHDDDEDDDNKDPLAGPNQGKKTKRRRTKESESSKKPSTTKETLKGQAPSKGSKTGKFASAKEPVKEPITEVVMDDAVNITGKLDWNNPEGDHYPFDLSKPLPLQVTTATRHSTAGDCKYWCFTDAKKCLKRYGRKEHFILLSLINTTSYVLVLPGDVNTTKYLVNTAKGSLVLPVHVNAAITKG